MDSPQELDTRGSQKMAEAGSMAELFVRRVRADRQAEALWTRSADTAFQVATWEELLHDVAAMVQTLERRGIAPGDRVVHLGENSRGWIILDLALAFIRAWHVPISTHIAPDQLREILAHCGPALAVVDDQATSDRLTQHGLAPAKVLTRDALAGRLAEADETSQESDSLLATLQARAEAIAPDDVGTLVYTSGTTGTPKGVMLTHRNLASNALALVHAYEEKPADRRLNFLPFSHLYARTCDLYTWIARGSQLVLAQSRETILADCQATRPTLLNGVPYFFQKVLEGLQKAGKLDTPGALCEALGGGVRMCSSGGAPLPLWVLEAFAKQDLLLCEGYGLTEASPVITVSTEEARRPGSVGRALPGVEVRVSQEGELETRGPHVMLGYYRDDEATAAVMDNGWLRTGDLATIDEDGFVWITGRQKELMVLSTGRKVSPSALELAIAADPLVAQVVVCGEGQKCLSALIVPEPSELRRRIKETRLWVFSKRQALAHPAVRGWFRELLDRRLSGRADYEQIGPFSIMGRGFTPESGEMTPKLSLRRDLIVKNEADRIRKMYAPGKVSGTWWRKLWT